MKKHTLKSMFVTCLGIIIFLWGNVVMANMDIYSAKNDVLMKADSVPGIRFLSGEQSKSLKINTAPVSNPVPLIVGTYWECHINSQEFEICRFKIVVCNDDQSFCVDVNGDRKKPSVKFLPRTVSESLDITKIPTTKPTPLSVGTYWDCRLTDQGLETCEIIIVICSEDQSICTQLP